MHRHSMLLPQFLFYLQHPLKILCTFILHLLPRNIPFPLLYIPMIQTIKMRYFRLIHILLLLHLINLKILLRQLRNPYLLKLRSLLQPIQLLPIHLSTTQRHSFNIFTYIYTLFTIFSIHLLYPLIHRLSPRFINILSKMFPLLFFR